MLKRWEKYRILATFSLINKYFWKTKIGPIFSIVLPFIFMVIYFVLGSSSDSKDKLGYFINGFPAYLSMSIIPLSIVTLPSMNIEFKNSILLRKIKTSGINKFEYNLICIIYFFIASILFSIITIILFALFSVSDISRLGSINWGTLTYGIILLSLVSISFGMFISTFIKTSLSSQLIGFAIFILTLTLSGQFIPVDVISGVEAIKYISLLSPLNYATNIFNIASLKAVSHSTNSIFDFTNDFIFTGFSDKPITLYNVWQKILFAFAPFLLIGVFETLSIHFFKWTGR
ncbi:ABC transporter permease [Malacoplasma iowae]|uniref:ABC transporter permease n=1 Tax=Malacoplasma iowae TaxID=2116 RepID=UPI0038736E69|nr:ABC transporter permease [Malacoplasma iowae]